MIENIRLAFQGIWGHKLRSVLTMLGIIIGIAAIITGILGMKKSKADGFKGTLGLIGMILGIASLLVNVICTIIGMVGGAAMAESYYYY